MPKYRLKPERTMEINPSTHPRVVQKMWTIRNGYGHRYAKICIPPTVSLFGWETPNWATPIYDKHAEKQVIYTWDVGEVRLAGQCWVDAVVRRRSAGRPATPTKTIGDLRVTSDRSCSVKEETRDYKFKISAAPLLHREVSKTCNKQRHDGRQSQRHEGR
jgi:hypothetical protein